MEAFTGTRRVAAQHAFDLGALEDYLRPRLPGFRGPLSVAQFKGGQSNPTYQLTTPTARYVMRAKPGPAAKLLRSAHAIEREFRVMRALADTPVPVARMHLLCEDESVIGRAFYVMEFVEGRVLWDQSLQDLPRTARGAIYDEMSRVVAALHQVDVHAVGLDDYGRPGNYFERQIGRWSQQYLASITQPIPAMDRLIEWLPTAIPASGRDESQACIVHGDYRLDNLIFHPKEPRVLAVLDWELSTIGHPLADFSYHCMSWHIPQALGRGIAGLDLQAAGLPSEQDYLQRYCARTGRGEADALAADWDFYLAYNLFRLAAIVQGVARRAVEGVAASAEAAAQGATARPLAELAWGFAERAMKGQR
jgi:aminoglycoside phosphotransferase (APT) family kinase protein